MVFLVSAAFKSHVQSDSCHLGGGRQGKYAVQQSQDRWHIVPKHSCFANVTNICIAITSRHALGMCPQQPSQSLVFNASLTAGKAIASFDWQLLTYSAQLPY